jgi:leucyl/phenylalanyl-tRNA--protein transferase
MVHAVDGRAVIHWLRSTEDPLPDTRRALGPGSEAPGLVAVGGVPTPRRLAEAYAKGIFPWYSDGQPVLWWSPDPRMALLTQEFRVSRSLRRAVKQFAQNPRCELRIDSAFRRVITACASTPRDGQNGTWIVPEMIDAYCQWHDLGGAHSFETWIDGELVGGLYGIGMGRMFFGESMFARRTDASKIALAALVCFCREHGIPMIDCQQHTGHLASLGARELGRAEFESRLSLNLGASPPGEWAYDPRWWHHLVPGAAEDVAP